MPFSNNNPITRDELLSRYFPQYHPVATFNSGLSGGSFLIEHQDQRFVVRQTHDPDAPQSVFLRQYRAYHDYRHTLHQSHISISVAGWWSTICPAR